MDKFVVKRKSTDDSIKIPDKEHDRAKKSCLDENDERQRDSNLANLMADPALRKPISSYHPNEQDAIRRAYWLKGPCQPRGHKFKQTLHGKLHRRFSSSWFDEYPTWLEYSISKEAAYCLCCYLFRSDCKKYQGGSDAFVLDGFTNWKKKEKLQEHVGGLNSIHNQASKNCQALMKQDQHVNSLLNKQTDQTRTDYRIRLAASVDCVRFLLRQGLAFRGHDESNDSNNQGNFLEILGFLANHNDDIRRVCLDNSPGNLKLVAPDIQKDIADACAAEISKVIIKDLGNSFFCILVDEARDVSMKEQMAVAIRYVNKQGQVIERFLDITHVGDTTASSLKIAIDAIFAKHGLSLSKLRGQGYDGASNMQGEFNGLKALILRENEHAYNVHCFAHQLQLALVAVAKNNVQVALFFNVVSSVVNFVGASCKRHDILQEFQIIKNREAFDNGELLSGQGLNQGTTLKRPGDTRWNSHYYTLISLMNMFGSIIEVLDFVIQDTSKSDQKVEAYTLLDSLQSFDFVFTLHLMRNILGITNELSQAMQRKDQDIINAMKLVKMSKERLQFMRDSEWDSLLTEVSSFCDKHDISIPDMDCIFVVRGRSRRNSEKKSNKHHYCVEVFYIVLDMQLQELNNRFNEVNTQLLLCMACLNPSDSFSSFEKDKLICLARFYPLEFSETQLLAIEDQLETYIQDVRSEEKFADLKEISSLSEVMVKTKKDVLYPLVYKLITLSLILPVATASVERAFSAMKIVKNRLRNRIGDQWLADSLITFIEKDIFNNIDNEVIMQHFQKMKTRRGSL